MPEQPQAAEIVIIGGGIIGCSTAYHLAKLGKSDVLLLEQGALTCGSTWHAAGLVGQLRNSSSITQLLKYSVDLYQKLESETGLATGWKMNGGLRLANNSERWTEIKRQATTAHSFGLEMELLSPREARDLWPLMNISDLVGAAFLPTDGQASPSDITQSIAKGARDGGVSILENARVSGINVADGRIIGVITSLGSIKCKTIVNCGGQWAREIGSMAGACVPLQSMQHQYMVTEAIEGVTTDLPTLRDPDLLTYFKEEVGGLVMGGYERNPIAWAEQGIPERFQFSLLDSNWDHFEPMMENAMQRVPALHNAGVKQLTNGPESFTPDGNFILGEAPEVRNFYVGAGFNAFGIAAGGGAGKALAEWIVGGEQPMDLWTVDIRRFSDMHREAAWVRDRTLELYGKHYTMAWPHEEHTSGRPYHVSPLYQRLQAANACFGSKLGWERPNWFADYPDPEDEYSFGRQNWFDYVGNEHLAARQRVALFDQSSFAKYEIGGRDAGRALSWICANDVSGAPGSLTYTQMLNSSGRIECDLTVARLTEDLFYVVTGTGFRTHDKAWIRKNIHPGLDTTLTDVTDQWGTLSLMGPNARDVLSKLTDTDLSTAGFPFGSCREITVAGENVRALRITFVGELGWELHMPIATTGTVYDALMKAGEEFGIANAGYRAIESLRLEKGYRVWSADITPSDSPLEAGLGWAIKLGTDMDFLGRASTEKMKHQPLAKRLACFTVEDPGIVLLGRETIYRDGAPVGWLTSGGWGYTLGKNIGYGYVRNLDGISTDFLKSGTYELEVACERIPCNLQHSVLYDPYMKKIKA